MSGAFESEIEKLLLEELKLPQSRKLEELQTQVIPSRLTEFSQITGTLIPFDIDWSSFHNVTALEFFDNVGILRLNMAFRGVCSDDATKKLVVSKLKKIKFKNVKDPKDKKMAYNDGVLEIHAVYDRSSVPMGEGIVSDKELEPFVVQQFGVRESQFKLNLETNVIPGRTKEVLEIYGTPVNYSFDWATFTTPDEYNFVDNCACHRINMALRSLSKDLIALLTKSKALTTIQITNVKEEAEKKLTFDKGVLHLVCAFGKGLSGCFSDGEILKLLKTKAK